MNNKALASLTTLSRKVTVDINNKLGAKGRNTPTFKMMFASGFLDDETQEVNHSERAIKGDVASRKYLLELIEQVLYKYKIKMGYIDQILDGYYINYFGSPEDMTTNDNPLLHSFLGKILIDKHADYELKLKKLARIVFQENYGYGVVDEFTELGVDSSYNKVEEVASFSQNSYWLKISGVNFTLDKIQVPRKVHNRLVKRISRCSPRNLSIAEPHIETDDLNGNRITLNCPNYDKYWTFNIRLHYQLSITKDVRIKLGSSSIGFEHFLDDVMKFCPRIIILGGQAVGKTTFLRSVVGRYPKNTSIATIESSFETDLEKNKDLIVKSLSTNGKRDVEDIMTDVFRFGLDGMVLSELRSPKDANMYINFSQRQKNGAITTTHGSDEKEVLYVIRDLLIKGGYYATSEAAMYQVCSAADLIIVLDVDLASGKRFVRGCYGVPKISEENSTKIEPNALFEYDFDSEILECAGGITEEMYNIFKKRNPLEVETLEVLRDGNYS